MSDLRERYAAIFRHAPGTERPGDKTPGEIADLILAVRDEELERLRAEVDQGRVDRSNDARRLDVQWRDKVREAEAEAKHWAGRVLDLEAEVERLQKELGEWKRAHERTFHRLLDSEAERGD